MIIISEGKYSPFLFFFLKKCFRHQCLSIFSNSSLIPYVLIFFNSASYYKRMLKLVDDKVTKLLHIIIFSEFDVNLDV